MKADAEDIADMLYPLFREIWVSERLPDEWKEAVIVKIPKKGNTTTNATTGEELPCYR